MVKVEPSTLVTALASLCAVHGMQLEGTAQRPQSWIQHSALGSVEKEQIEVCLCSIIPCAFCTFLIH